MATFEEQQEARNEYQDMVRSTKGRAINLNPTIEQPNPAGEEGSTMGEQASSRKDETTAAQIIEAADPNDDDLAKAAKESTEGDGNVMTAQEFLADVTVVPEEDADADESPAPSDNKGEWVAHRMSTHGLSEADANEKTKQELIDLK